jgi:hypothetical protein
MDRIERLKDLIPKLKANKKILPLKIESLEWELKFLESEKKQLTLTDVVVSEAELVCKDCKGFGWIADKNGRRKDHCKECD